MVSTTEQGRLAESKLILEMLEALLERVGLPLKPGLSFLDIGCGHGTLVKLLRQRGIAACGADFYPNPLGIPEPNSEDQEYLKPINMTPYNLPFPDASFDFVYSNQVIEHVDNLEETFREMGRLMRPGAVGLHIYPATWRVRESHIRVPFAGGLQSKPWIVGWTLLGAGTRPVGLSPLAAGLDNYRYMREKTAYRPVREVGRIARKIFRTVRWVEGDYLFASTGRARFLGRSGVFVPLFARLYRHFVSRVLLLEK